MKRTIALLGSLILLCGVAIAQPPGRGNGHGRGHGHGSDDDDDRSSTSSRYVFSRSDRDRIVSCMSGGREGLPPGLAKRDRLPPGLERQVQRNGTLPPGLQKKVQPLPQSCEVRLPRLPSTYTRVVIGNYVILRDIHNKILDLIDLGKELKRNNTY